MEAEFVYVHYIIKKVSEFSVLGRIQEPRLVTSRRLLNTLLTIRITLNNLRSKTFLEEETLTRLRNVRTVAFFFHVASLFQPQFSQVFLSLHLFKKWKTSSMFLSSVSLNLLAFYLKCNVNLGLVFNIT